MPGRRLTLRAGPAPVDPIGRARAALAAGRLDDVEPALTDADGPAALGLRVELAARRGEAASVEHGLGALRAASVADPDAGAELARVLLAIGRREAGVRTACEVVTAEPGRFRLWETLFETAILERSTAGSVLETAERALDHLDVAEHGAARIATLLGARANLRERLRGDPVESLVDAVRAGLLGGSFAVAVQLVRSDPVRFGDATVAAAQARLALDPARAAEIETVVRRARSGATGAPGRLERHLGRIAAACRQADATVVLLTYPKPIGALDTVVRRVAAANSVDLIDLQPAFERALRGHPRAELFVPDGHCNDAGYALIAQIVRADVVSRE